MLQLHTLMSDQRRGRKSLEELGWSREEIDNHRRKLNREAQHRRRHKIKRADEELLSSLEATTAKLKSKVVKLSNTIQQTRDFNFRYIFYLNEFKTFVETKLMPTLNIEMVDSGIQVEYLHLLNEIQKFLKREFNEDQKNIEVLKQCLDQSDV